jgi:hypothetical protein
MTEREKHPGAPLVRCAPNLVALEILKRVRERQQDRREADPSRTQELIRSARDGRMYGREHPE